MAGWVGPRLVPGDRVLVTNWELGAGPLGGLLGWARRAGATVDVVWHGSDIVRPERRPVGGPDRAGFVRAVADLGGRHLTVSHFLATRLRDTHAIEATVLPAPIDPVAAVVRGPRWIVVARLVPGKGVEHALRLAATHGRGLTVVGDGPARPALAALAATLGVDAVFTGPLPRGEVPWEGHEAVLLLADAEEGLGLSLLEGAARGLASLGTRTGGIPEAALHLLDPGMRGPIPDLMSPDAAQAWVRTHHGSVRCVEILAGKAPEGS
jgi:glycosyltransferase involved in cell wall biosynthesis